MTDGSEGVLRIVLAYAIAVPAGPLLCRAAGGQEATHPVDQYNVVWTTPSTHAGESMPCSGGDIEA